MLEAVLTVLGVLAILLVLVWLWTLFLILKVTHDYDQDMGRLRDRYDLGDLPEQKKTP